MLYLFNQEIRVAWQALREHDLSLCVIYVFSLCVIP